MTFKGSESLVLEEQLTTGDNAERGASHTTAAALCLRAQSQLDNELLEHRASCTLRTRVRESADRFSWGVHAVRLFTFGQHTAALNRFTDMVDIRRTQNTACHPRSASASLRCSPNSPFPHTKPKQQLELLQYC